jgi:hypothetical protein
MALGALLPGIGAAICLPPGSYQASFNMVTAMLCRIHQSRPLDLISSASADQVSLGIEVYKIRSGNIFPASAPFYPWGMPDVTDREAPVALGMCAPGWIAVAV